MNIKEASILCCVLCSAEKPWTLQEISDIRTRVPPLISDSARGPPTAAAAQGVVTKLPGCPTCGTNRNAEQDALREQFGIACLQSARKALSGRDAAAAKLTRVSSFRLPEGWNPHCSTWFNHSTKPQPEAADRKQMGFSPSFHPPNILCWKPENTERWWDKTAQHSWVKHHFSKGDGAALCNWKWRFQTGSSAWGNEASVTVLSLEVQRSPWIKIPYDNVPLFPTASKRTLSFCSALAAARAH